jgi:uncharacterized protein (TIGR02449 family)
MEEALEHLHDKLEYLLGEFHEMKQRNQDLIVENHMLHEKVGRLQEKNTMAGDKIHRMLAQLKSMQEVI